MRLPIFLGTVVFALASSGPAPAAELKVLLPLGRTAYQTNERIDLTVARSGKEPLTAGELQLKVEGEDGSRLDFTFPAHAVAAEGGAARAVEHLHVNGWLLRPGKYTVEAACDGTTAKTSIDVHSHVRRSTFRTINWGGQAKGNDQLVEGEDNLGYNLFLGYQEDGNMIRAGVDYMRNCTMSGAHQMDLRMECDWSDPYVIRGGTRRVVREAFMDRTWPNAVGVHFYDEPGLTWHKDANGEMTPHGIPSQVQSFEAAFGHPPISYKEVNPKDPRDVARWAHWARWKLGFMDAAWQDAQFGVSYVRPDFLSVTQSQYGWSAFTDGYYFNVVRSLPVISGHGGYHDYGPGYFNPSYFLEMARARDWARPNWYLPTWYDNTKTDEFRLEQYLSFQTDIQGLMSPPGLDPIHPDKLPAAQGIVESNHLASRLGTIFTKMAVTRPPVAMLYSLSDLVHAQAQDRSLAYAHGMKQGKNLGFTYLAGKLLQQQFMPVVDEDVRDGSLAANHKAVILTSVDYLAPDVVTGLEAFVKQGGLVLTTGDCKAQVQGAVNLDVVPKFPDQAKIDELNAAKKYQEAGALQTLRHSLQVARQLADAIRPQLEKAGIKPVFKCDEPGIVATRQAAGDIEYLFAVNATHDPQGNPMLGVKPATATITLEAPTAGFSWFEGDDVGVYDAVRGGPVQEFVQDKQQMRGKFHFGPGEMRVFARTARRIGTVKTATPVLRRDYTLTQAPLSVNIGAALLDRKGGLLSGAAPLHVRVVDPLGNTRYDLYRATDRGTMNVTLPLAVNDPAGKWQVVVKELLNNTADTATFTLEAVPTCGAASGETRRAVHLGDDRRNVFRFFRTHQHVTVVTGSSDYNKAAADRLAKSLEPWDVRCTVITAAEANKPRTLTAEEAPTWVGLDFAGSGQIKPGDKNSPSLAGFAIRGPVVLLGTPEDNPLIKFLLDQKFLPYAPNKETLPGPGRGYVAWQLDGIGAQQESVTLVAYDAKGMGEAVGTVYEMAAGLEPLTPLALPSRSTVAAASKGQTAPELSLAWSALLADRIVGLKPAGDKLSALTHAGTLAEVGADGKVASQRVLEGGAYQNSAKDLQTSTPANVLAEAQKKAGPGKLVKLVASNNGLTAVAYWGGLVNVFDQGGALKAQRRLPQDVTALTWSGQNLIAGDADGRLVAFVVK